MEKEYVGNRIASLRLAKNISARKLSFELGQSSEYINQIENFKIMPSIKSLVSICEFFNITMAEFFDESNSYLLQSKALINELNNLTPDEVEKALELVKLVSKKV